MQAKIITILAACVLLACCSPKKRLARLVKNNPELLSVQTLEADTTVIVPEIRLDTVVRFAFSGSTPDSFSFPVGKGRATVKKVGDNLAAVAVTIPADSIPVSLSVDAPLVVVDPKPKSRLSEGWDAATDWLTNKILIIALMILLFFIFRRKPERDPV